MNLGTQPRIGTQTASAAFENFMQPATGPVTMVSLLGYNNGPAQFVQVHDSAGPPAPGAIPLFMMPVPASAPFYIDTPLRLINGLAICNSSTAATLTAGAANCWFITRHL